MSSIARWSYQSVATVWPYDGRDDWSGTESYGQPYHILCGWEGKAETRKDKDGSEFVSRNIFWTECFGTDGTEAGSIPKRGDMIAKGQHTSSEPVATAEQIQTVTDWEMAAFGDNPDYEIVT